MPFYDSDSTRLRIQDLRIHLIDETGDGTPIRRYLVHILITCYCFFVQKSLEIPPVVSLRCYSNKDYSLIVIVLYCLSLLMFFVQKSLEILPEVSLRCTATKITTAAGAGWEEDTRELELEVIMELEWRLGEEGKKDT